MGAGTVSGCRAINRGVAALLATGVLISHTGCMDRGDHTDAIVHSAAQATAYVASLGNLRTGAPPSSAQVRLATFLFGAEPEPPLGLVKPTHVLAGTGELWICDGALGAVLRWSPGTRALGAAPLIDPPSGPVAIAPAAAGERLVAAENGVIVRYSAQGRPVQRYALPSGSRSRVGGMALVGDELWVSDVPAHRIEVFDATSAAHRRSIGRRGRGPGEFGFPLDIAAGRDGRVYIVDMLNARVQVLDAAGRWIRDIGGPGDRMGTFGRPKAVAIGPDGTVFVVDAASQCVHAFDEDGRALLAFGGATDGVDALVLPAGIATAAGPLDAARRLPASFETAYYVLVAEQIVRPGLRVYAWSGSRAPPEPSRASSRSWATVRTASVENPHWQADRCSTCHSMSHAAPQPIAPADVDRLCLSCHDGKKAVDEAHPIGRRAETRRTRVPPGWPLVGDRLGCLTCHDVRRHCDAPEARPADNPAFVRGFDPHNRLATCLQCHTSDEWRVNPHRSTVAGLATQSASCGFCHVSTPRAVGGDWVFDAALRDSATRLCQNCHTMHADPAPRGHLGAVVDEAMLRIMLDGERERGIDGRTDSPRLLPLDGGRVACSTCHNPHAADAAPAAVFRSPTALLRSAAATDEGKALRIEHMALCRYCHPK